MPAITQEVHARLDALAGEGAGVFFERQLEHIMPTALEEKTPVLNDALFAVNPIPDGAKTYTHRMLTEHGAAAWISNYSSDLPRVGFGAKEQTFNVKTMGDSYGYSIDDIAAAMFANVPLDAKKAKAARRAIEEKSNQVHWYGDDEQGLFGVLNFPYVPREALSDPITSATAADTIIAELNALVNGVHTRTKQIARPSRVMVPLDAWTYMSTTPRSATSDTTILDYFIAKSPFVAEVIPVNELAGAGPDGEDLILVDSPGLFERRPAYMFKQLPPQERNLEFVINCLGRTGGISCDYPFEAVIGILPAA